MYALGFEFGSAAQLSERPGSLWNCLWGNALKRSPGIIRKSRVSYPGPGFLSSATWPLLPKKHYNGLNQTKTCTDNMIYCGRYIGIMFCSIERYFFSSQETIMNNIYKIRDFKYSAFCWVKEVSYRVIMVCLMHVKCQYFWHLLISDWNDCYRWYHINDIGTIFEVP